MLLRISYTVLGLVVLLSTMPVRASAAESVFSQITRARLAEAATRDDFPTYNSTVVAEIARSPVNVEQIIREAIILAPGFRNKIVHSAQRTFPGFYQQIETAASGKAQISTTQTSAPTNGNGLGWSGEIDLGGSRSTGNTDREQVSTAVEILRKYVVWNHEMKLSFDFARRDRETRTRRLVTSLESRYDPSNGFYGFLFFQYEDDKFSGFDYELTESAGVGYWIVKTQPVVWVIEIGPGARQSVVSETGKTETEIVGRGKSVFTWNISDTAKFSNDTTVTIGNDRTTTDNLSALSTRILGKLWAKFSFEIRHNSDSPANTKSTDTLSKISIAYKF